MNAVAIRTVYEHTTGVTQSWGLNYLPVITLALKYQHFQQNNFHLRHPVALHKLQNNEFIIIIIIIIIMFRKD